MKRIDYVCRVTVASGLLLLVLNGAAWYALLDPPARGATGFDPETGLALDDGHRTLSMLSWYDVKAAGVRESEAGTILDAFHEIATAGLDYEPWSEYAERAIASPLVNVETTPEGFRRRHTPCTPRAHARHIDCFGSSTTFGWHAADKETWPSSLARATGAEVHNYGHGSYSPQQEVALFSALLRAGHHPDLAIFMDGNVPARPASGIGGALSHGLALEQGAEPELALWVRSLAVFRYLHRFEPRPPPRWIEGGAPLAPDEAGRTQARCWREAHALGRAFGVQVVVVLAPNAYADAPLECWRAPRDRAYVERVRAPSREAEDRLRQLADLDLDLTDAAAWTPGSVLDECHYAPAFADALGLRVAGALAAR